MSIEMIAYIAIQEMNVKCLLFVLGDNKIIRHWHTRTGRKNATRD